jgi:RhtB (resistance to homoserine/threonine) family protein
MKSVFFEYMPSLISLTLLQMVALISPGPDFAIVVRNSLIYSRKTAIMTALGIATGILVHVTYTLLGLGFIISQTAWLFSLFTYLGASYLIYIGYKGLRAKKGGLSLGNATHHHDIAALAAFRSGFFTNALNPKAMLFFLSLFTVFLSPHTPTAIMITYGVITFVTTLLWFVFVALCFSSQKLRKYFSSISHWIERITGGLLILLGVKLLFTKQT